MALLFTADGDMRQAINNMQATYTGFETITEANVFKVHIFYNFELAFHLTLI
jgi:DNA polymerase III delta prime subunit